MADSCNSYPKFLGFLYLLFPDLYQRLANYSSNSELIEAKLIATNRPQSYQATIYSEGETESGETFRIIPNISTSEPYSWDWRWVHTVEISFDNQKIFKADFKQKVIALPSGRHPLSHNFFENVHIDFKTVIEKMLEKNCDSGVSSLYSEYLC